MNNVIYTAVDHNYESYATACFNSIEKNYPNHPLVLVYANDISDDFRYYVNGLKNFQIKAGKTGYEFSNLGPVDNDIVYLKYLLWFPDEFDEYDNVLHLDCDTLVLKPLDDLFDTKKFLIFDNDERSKDFKMFNNGISFDLKNISCFGNAGVFVVPKKYRTIENHHRLLSLTDEYNDDILYADQSIINLWCIENDIGVIKDSTYNFQPQFFSHSDNSHMLEDIHIIHFAAKKPDTVEFMLWWRVPNGISTLLHNLYKEYLS